MEVLQVLLIRLTNLKRCKYVFSHALEVEASDGIWSKSASVTIQLEDVNDNAPRYINSKFLLYCKI